MVMLGHIFWRTFEFAAFFKKVRNSIFVELQGFAKRPKSAPGRLETVYPQKKKVVKQSKFDEFGGDAPPISGAESEATKAEIDKYGALAEDTIFLLEKTLPEVEGELCSDIHQLLRRYSSPL